MNVKAERQLAGGVRDRSDAAPNPSHVFKIATGRLTPFGRPASRLSGPWPVLDAIS